MELIFKLEINQCCQCPMRLYHPETELRFGFSECTYQERFTLEHRFGDTLDKRCPAKEVN